MTSSPIDRRALPKGGRVHLWRGRDGWNLRAFTWPSERQRPRGSILFQGGRGDIFEKYLESFAHWHSQGWSVSSFDWRGQGGSGRLTQAGNCGHIEDYADYVRDMEEVYRQWSATTPDPHVVIGHSMGGHLILRAMTEGVIKPDAAVLVAPMLGFIHGLFGPFAERAARILGGVGDSSRPAWRDNEKPYTRVARSTLLTHDPDRYADELWWHRHQPETYTGSPSWRWVIEGFRSMRELAADKRLKTMQIPVLMLVAEHDGLVDAKAALKLAPKLPDTRVVTFGRESAHEILREVDPVRNRALGEIDLFLAARAQQR